jgi:uncharacterized protein (UPF0335 family)
MQSQIVPRGNNSISGDELNVYIERIEHLEDDRSLINLSIRDAYNEAKCAGYEADVIRRLIWERKQPAEKIERQYSLLDLYKTAIG